MHTLSDSRSEPVKVNNLSDAEREQYRVLLIKMKEFEASGDSRVILGRKPNRAAILSTTRAGLVAAQETFAESGAVVLEESEKRHWFAHVHPIDHNKLWWFALAWWTLMESRQKRTPSRPDTSIRLLRAVHTGSWSQGCNGVPSLAASVESCGGGTGLGLSSSRRERRCRSSSCTHVPPSTNSSRRRDEMKAPRLS